jgi:hypothetical protein
MSFCYQAFLWALGCPRLVFRLVKSRINRRIRRNCNGIFISYNYSRGIEFIDGGFVRIISCAFRLMLMRLMIPSTGRNDAGSRLGRRVVSAMHPE